MEEYFNPISSNSSSFSKIFAHSNETTLSQIPHHEFYTNVSGTITYDPVPDNISYFEDEIRREFQITLRNYLYELYLKKKREELYDVPWTLIIVLSILYGTLSLLSLFGNGLVIWVVLVSRKMRTVTNMYIVNLALADVIIGLFCIPFQFQAALLQRWHLPDFLCAFCPFFQVLSVNLSVFTLSAIALDRHRAVMRPLKARTSKKQAIIFIACIWVAAVLLALPTYIDYKVITKRTMFLPPHPYCRNVGLSRNFRLVYNIALVATQYFIPLIIISVAYVRMGVRLWGRQAPGNKEESRDALILRSKKRVIKMLVLVVTLFAVCWFPLQMYNFLQYVYSSINNFQYINVVWFCIHWLAMSNSCVNPFIYAIYNDKFQDEFATRLGCLGKCCRLLRKNRNPAGQATSSVGIETMPTLDTASGASEQSPRRARFAAVTSSRTHQPEINNTLLKCNKTEALSSKSIVINEKESNLLTGTKKEKTSGVKTGKNRNIANTNNYQKVYGADTVETKSLSNTKTQCEVVSRPIVKTGVQKVVTKLITNSSSNLQHI